MKVSLRIAVLAALLTLPGCVSTSQNINLDLMARASVPKWEAVKGKALSGPETPPLASLDEVNKYVNKIAYRSDKALYGVKDKWATPLEFFQNGGDCEDYAIAKRWLVIKNKLAAEKDIKLVFVHDDLQREDHMILIVGGKVLDNQQKKVYLVNSSTFLRYRIIGEAI